ncbi:hypothetical protein GCM10009661_84380 [Catellatospora chokoriensis]
MGELLGMMLTGLAVQLGVSLIYPGEDGWRYWLTVFAIFGGLWAWVIPWIQRQLRSRRSGNGPRN